MREAERHDPERVKRRVVLVVDAETQLNLVEAGAAAYGVDVTVVLDINHLVEYVWRRRMYSMTRAAATVAGLSRDTRNPVDTCTDYLLVQGADRLWSTQDMGWLVPSGAIPFDMGGQFAATSATGWRDRAAGEQGRRMPA